MRGARGSHSGPITAKLPADIDPRLARVSVRGMTYTLITANRNYSSWSLRPWLLISRLVVVLWRSSTGLGWLWVPNAAGMAAALALAGGAEASRVPLTGTLRGGAPPGASPAPGDGFSVGAPLAWPNVFVYNASQHVSTDGVGSSARLFFWARERLL